MDSQNGFREYHKINSLFKRDKDNGMCPIIGEYSLKEFGYLEDNSWIFYEKIDGTNIRIGWDSVEKRVLFGGRTDRAEIPKHLMKALMEKFTVDLFNQHYLDKSMVIYGEGYGPKIQKVGHLYRPDPGFIGFDVKIGCFWLEDNDVDDVLKTLNVDRVPFHNICTLGEAIEEVRKGLKSQLNPELKAEGLVGTPTVPLLTRSGGRIIVKIKPDMVG